MSKPRHEEPVILERPDHPISRKNISRNTVKVLYRLNNSGYKAYLVGGGVRDLMLGDEPKDFDVSTDARPEQIRKLFRNSRIIGRRFRLVHVYFRGEVVEVATFRREPDPEEQDSADHELLITSDNTWGTPREDAFRRDFTINGLFYNIGDFSVIDYVGGIDDLEEGVVRCIGDPWVRFREDPVRMFRACEFAGRLGFDVEERSQQAIRELRSELEKASPARLTEEVVDLMGCGSAEPALDWIRRLGLGEVLLPELDDFEQAEKVGLGNLWPALGALDDLIEEGRKPGDAVALGLLLLPRIMLQRDKREKKKGGLLSRREIESLIEDALSRFRGRYNLSRARSQEIRLALQGFFRMCEPHWKDAARVRFTRRPYYRDARMLFEMLVQATGEGQQALDEWRAADQEAKSKKSSRSGGGGKKGSGGERRRRRRRPRRKPH